MARVNGINVTITVNNTELDEQLNLADLTESVGSVVIPDTHISLHSSNDANSDDQERRVGRDISGYDENIFWGDVVDSIGVPVRPTMEWEGTFTLDDNIVTDPENIPFGTLVDFDEGSDSGDRVDIRIHTSPNPIHWVAEYAEHESISREAIEKSKQLLLSFLNDDQKKELEESGEFTVESQDGEHYIINTSSVYRKGKIQSYCLNPHRNYGNLPVYDVMLIKMMMLKYDLKKFLNLANPVFSTTAWRRMWE